MIRFVLPCRRSWWRTCDMVLFMLLVMTVCTCTWFGISVNWFIDRTRTFCRCREAWIIAEQMYYVTWNLWIWLVSGSNGGVIGWGVDLKYFELSLSTTHKSPSNVNESMAVGLVAFLRPLNSFDSMDFIYRREQDTLKPQLLLWPLSHKSRFIFPIALASAHLPSHIVFNLQIASFAADIKFNSLVVRQRICANHAFVCEVTAPHEVMPSVWIDLITKTMKKFHGEPQSLEYYCSILFFINRVCAIFGRVSSVRRRILHISRHAT